MEGVIKFGTQQWRSSAAVERLTFHSTRSRAIGASRRSHGPVNSGVSRRGMIDTRRFLTGRTQAAASNDAMADCLKRGGKKCETQHAVCSR